MYATEKYVKAEAKDLRESINQVSADLGSDIMYLNEQLLELARTVEFLQSQLKQSLEKRDNE
jgi:hypothetical protein